MGSGWFIAFILNLTILPFFVTGITNQSIYIAVIIGIIYTSVSMLRSFIFRRIFSKLE